MTEADLLAVLNDLGGRSYAKEVAQWVHSTRELPLEALLERHGVLVQHEPDQIAQQLGLRVKENGGLFITNVLRGSAAEAAGFASGDEWIAVSSGAKDAAGPWRLQTWDDLLLYTSKAKKLTAWIARDKRLMQLSLTLPALSKAWRLNAGDLVRVNKWLDEK
jgi:predicted metalloprotease with PDZ domain